MFTKILTRNFDQPDLHEMEVYEKLGGYRMIRQALRRHTPEEIVQMVQRSGLRGRGGAGFPTGIKWGFIPRNSDKPTYLCVNADESEPGTFKDRHIILHDPHQLLEGIMVSAYAIQSRRAFIYIRGEMAREAAILNDAIAQAEKKNYLGHRIFGEDFDLQIQVVRGAGAYICGEETGLLESIEGKRGQPRTKPPFPAVCGLYGCPTIINNVETLINVPHIVANGPEWFAAIGKDPRNTGPKLYGVSGQVKRPGVYEFDMTITLKELIYDVCGGLTENRALKGVIPGGSSVPILLPEEIDVAMDFDSLAARGTMLGSAGVVVIGEGTCMVRVARRVAQFYAFESCGQCPPCREGTAWLHKILQRIESGGGHPGELDLLAEICDNMKSHTICPLSDAAAMPIESYIRKYRAEFEEHLSRPVCACS